MARVVVIASAEVDRGALSGVVQPDDELVVVVPAVEQSRLDWLANDEDEARSRAQDVASQVGRAAPADVAAVEVKPEPPGQLAADAVARYRPDRVVLALREGEDATWLEKGELASLPAEIAGVPLVRTTL